MARPLGELKPGHNRHVDVDEGARPKLIDLSTFKHTVRRHGKVKKTKRDSTKSVFDESTLVADFFRVGRLWELADIDLASLIGVDIPGVVAMHDTGGLGRVAAETVLATLDLYWELECQFGDGPSQGAWLRASHPILGHRPIDMIMESSAGMEAVTDYIRGVNHGGGC